MKKGFFSLSSSSGTVNFQSLNNFDFDNQALQTSISDDYIYAHNTSLGADDGYGVCEILYILDNMQPYYPNIEAVFTTQEETGMYGAQGLDCSSLKGNVLINLDGTSFQDIIQSCASGCFLEYTKNISSAPYTLKQNELVYSFSVNNLLSGHSGECIHLHRANALKVCAKFLRQLNDVKIINFDGGEKDNVIPQSCVVTFVSQEISPKVVDDFKAQFALDDPNETFAELSLTKHTEKQAQIIQDDFLLFIVDFKDGLLQTNENNQPISSINLATIRIDDNKITMRAMLRNNSQDLDNQRQKEYMDFAYKYGFTPQITHFAPSFTNENNAKLIDICKNAYYKLFNSNATIVDIHAGLEGGVFAQKINGLQAVTLACNVDDIHTTKEKLQISSLQNLFKLLDEILINISELD